MKVVGLSGNQDDLEDAVNRRPCERRTHDHRRSLEQKSSANGAQRQDAACGSLLRRDHSESDYAAAGGFSAWRCDSVKISTPLAVTPTECSNCADSERSRVTAVQPSDRIFTCGLPRLIIGSMVKNIPGFSTTPSPGRAI